MSKYKLNINNVYGVCACGCVLIKGENDVYKPSQVINYNEITTNTIKAEFWCCNGCQNGFYKDGEEHSWIEKRSNKHSS